MNISLFLFGFVLAICYFVGDGQNTCVSMNGFCNLCTSTEYVCGGKTFDTPTYCNKVTEESGINQVGCTKPSFVCQSFNSLKTMTINWNTSCFNNSECTNENYDNFMNYIDAQYNDCMTSREQTGACCTEGCKTLDCFCPLACLPKQTYNKTISRVVAKPSIPYCYSTCTCCNTVTCCDISNAECDGKNYSKFGDPFCCDAPCYYDDSSSSSSGGQNLTSSEQKSTQYKSCSNGLYSMLL